jgi:hypothetical protein
MKCLIEWLPGDKNKEKPMKNENERVRPSEAPAVFAAQARINGGRQPDLVCLSHLRWDFVYQRPQHLMSRCARDWRVFFVEEPIGAEGPARLAVRQEADNLWVAVPHLPPNLDREESEGLQRQLLDDLLDQHQIEDFVLWYYTPMAVAFSDHLKPQAIVYDCMDELSAFRGAPPILRQREGALFARADLVFTGGMALYEAKRERHPHVYPFPSSIDLAHFGRARRTTTEPADQAPIPHPRLGFFGVIDERFDIELLDNLATDRPDWHFVIIGPTVKIDPDSLPRHENIHYLGMKRYQELPDYLAGWDVALLLFALNESTRFISPTKTPEYLAGAKPVVSTPIQDVIRPYGDQGLVHIARSLPEFVTAVESALAQGIQAQWLEQVDAFLSHSSWEHTWNKMRALIVDAMNGIESEPFVGQTPIIESALSDKEISV